MIIRFNTSYCNVLWVLKPKTKFGCSCFVMVKSIIYVQKLFILKKLNNVLPVLNHLHSLPNYLWTILMYLPQNKLRNYFLSDCFTGFSSETSLRSLGFFSFTTPACFLPSNTHGAVCGALQEGGLLKGSGLWVALERLIYCGVGVGMRDEQKRHMEGEMTPSINIIFVTQTDILRNILLWLRNSNGKVWRALQQVPNTFSKGEKALNL